MTVANRVLTAEAAKSNPAYCTALTDFLYQLADDELVIGHRASEWLGVAPDIEEDVAFSSISQDEVGHAAFYYELLASLGEGQPDQLAFARFPEQRRNAVFVELENGDWAHTIVRHYLYDVFEDVRLQALAESNYEPLRQGAVKIRREEFYHLLHHETWFRRLARAGGEARERLVDALTSLWTGVDGLFDFGPYANDLTRFGIVAKSAAFIRDDWSVRVTGALTAEGLAVPVLGAKERSCRNSHTLALSSMLETMAEVYHLDTAAVW